MADIPDNQSTFSSRLVLAMKNAGFRSQSALARASGVPQSTLSRLLTGAGAQGPETNTVRRIAAACKVTFEWLMHGDGVPAPVCRNLTAKEVEWLDLLENLGSDDIFEFAQLIRARQARNRRLLGELGTSKRPSSPESPKLQAGAKS